MRILITGAEGFVGSRLLPALASVGHVAEATGFDLFDTAAVEARLDAGPWDCIVHLAAISHVPTCERDQSLAFRVNLAGTAQLVEAMRRHAPRAWLVFASTAQVYAAPGEDEHDVVIDEERRIEPQSVYARTKWLAELVIGDASRREGLRATVLRLFNHTHKSQSREFFLPHLYHSIVETPRGAVPVGNLELSRDFGSIQDLVGAFAARLARPPPASSEVFNICSGSAKRLADVAEELARRLGANVELVTDPARLRASEARSIAGSHQRFSSATGWEPRCSTASELITAFLAD